jgi:hypothetical protein
MRSGRYSYRFSGFSVQPTRKEPWHLVGIGTIDVEGGEQSGLARGGKHRASIHRHNSSEPSFTHSLFDVTGDYVYDAKERCWKSTLTFEQQQRSDGRPLQTLVGQFVIVGAGEQDKYWIISAGASISVGGQTSEVSEVVEGTFVRVSDIP